MTIHLPQTLMILDPTLMDPIPAHHHPVETKKVTQMITKPSTRIEKRRAAEDSEESLHVVGLAVVMTEMMVACDHDQLV